MAKRQRLAASIALILAGVATAQAQVRYLVPENYLPAQTWHAAHEARGQDLPCDRETVRNVFKAILYTSLNPKDPDLLALYDVNGQMLHSVPLGPKPNGQYCNLRGFYRER